MANFDEKIDALKAKLNAEPALKEELSKIEDLDKFVEKINASGFEITKEEVLAMNDSLKNEGVIEDEQLDAVSGGCLIMLGSAYLLAKKLFF